MIEKYSSTATSFDSGFEDEIKETSSKKEEKRIPCHLCEEKKPVTFYKWGTWLLEEESGNCAEIREHWINEEIQEDVGPVLLFNNTGVIGRWSYICIGYCPKCGRKLNRSNQK